jgi:hypothetical protein
MLHHRETYTLSIVTSIFKKQNESYEAIPGPELWL